MDARRKAPFFAPEDRLPAPLPCPEVIAAGIVIKEFTGRRVVRVGESYIIKYGLNVSLTEGETLLFIKETQTFSVPEVFALYTKEDANGNQVNYIIMEYILGETLEICWPLLEPREKGEIACQLGAYFSMLRKIPTPGYFGCVRRQPYEQSIFWTSPDDKPEQQQQNQQNQQISGPFNSEAELNSALVKKYLYNGWALHSIIQQKNLIIVNLIVVIVSYTFCLYLCI